jgi:hypothetical protein
MAEVVQQSPFMSGPMAGTVVNHIFDDNGKPDQPWTWTFKGMKDTSGNTITNQQWESQNMYRSAPPPTQETTVESNVKDSSESRNKVSDVSPIPLTSSLLPVSSTPPPPPTKTAPIDTILFDDNSLSIEIMTDLVFEDIGGHELLSISRSDIINGQPVSYSPIKNLGLVQQRYNPNNILGLQSTSDKYFANFAIKFDEKVPLQGNGINGLNVYIDEVTGDLIIETINMNSDEQIEVQVAINGTIYEANFGEITS